MFNYIPSQWFKYGLENRQMKYCQTDGLLFTPRQRKVLIVEFKLKHTADAYWQVEDKYIPVIRRIFPDWEVSVCEVVNWYDPSTPFPVEVNLRKNLLDVRPGEFGVHIWNPR